MVFLNTIKRPGCLPDAGKDVIVVLPQIQQVESSDRDDAAHTNTQVNIYLSQFNVLCLGSKIRKRQHASPESHGGQQGEDAGLEDFMLQTAAVLLTPAFLLNLPSLTCVRTRCH